MIKKYYYYSPAHIQHQKLNIALRLILFTVLLVVSAGLLTIKTIYAFFSDMSVSSNNTFTAALTFDNPTPTPTPQPSEPENTATLSIRSDVSNAAKGEEFILDASVASNGLSVSASSLDINYPATSLLGLSFLPGTFFTTPLGSPSLTPGSASASFGRTPPITAGVDGVMGRLKLRALDATNSPILVEYNDSSTVTALEFSTNVAGIKNPYLVSITDPSQTVVINEINWAGSTTSSADEWIELRNTTDSPIDISGWKIINFGSASTAGNIFTLPNSTIISANGFYLIANFGNTSASSALDVIPDVVENDINLLNEGEQIVLKNNADTTIDVAHISTNAWPAGSNASPRKSMQRKDPPEDGTANTNWQTATSAFNIDAGQPDLGTPKTTN